MLSRQGKGDQKFVFSWQRVGLNNKPYTLNPAAVERTRHIQDSQDQTPAQPQNLVPGLNASFLSRARASIQWHGQARFTPGGLAGFEGALGGLGSRVKPVRMFLKRMRLSAPQRTTS